MAEYYVFDDENTAVSAEAYIDEVGGTPRVGTRLSDGAPMPDKQKTERWAVPQQRVDGKWVFPRLPQSIRDKYPQEVSDAFNTQFSHVVEDYSSDWFPVEEES